MRRLRGLLLKELWQHAVVLLAVGAFIASVQVILLLGSAVGPRTITMLESHATFMRVFLPVLGLALGHRLVVREYQAHTQRFLEALPVYRWEVLLTKFVIGMAVLGAAVTASLACSSTIALIKEPITLDWLTLVFVRSQVFALTLFSTFFLMGLLGRWRVPVYLAVGLLLLFLDQGTEVDVSRFGPFGLVGERLVLERHAAPWGQLGVSMAISAVAMALAAALTLLDEGSAAESLAKRMSRRERVAVGVVLSLALIAYDVADPQHDKVPFEFEHESVLRGEGGRLSVLYLDERHRAAAEAVAGELETATRTAQRELGFEAPLGPLHVALRTTLSANEFEPVPLEEPEDGVLVRANFAAPDFSRRHFVAFVLERVIEHASDGRAAFEPHAWVRAGTAGLIADGEPDLRAAFFYRRHRRPSYASLERYERTSERFGPDVARALAVSAASAFDALHGRDAWMAFAREVLREEPPPGVFAALAERRRPTRERFIDAVGSLETFEAQWSASLRRDAGVARATGWLEHEIEEGQLRSVRWGIRFETPPAEGAFCALLHAPLGPFDEALTPEGLLREALPCAELDDRGARLVGRYGARERAFFAIEMETAHAPVRLWAERTELD